MTTTADNKTIGRPEWLSQAVWPFQVRTAVVDGAHIAYTDEGQGPVLLLVHDGMWSYVWGQLIEGLRERYRVVTLDFPGSGLSPSSSQHPPGLEADSGLLERLVDHLDLDAMTIVGHDLGGPVSLGLAARRPEIVQGMVLINTFAWPPHVRSLRAMFRVMSSPPIRILNTTTNLVPRLTSGSFGLGRHLDGDARKAFLGGFSRTSQRRRFHEMMLAARHEIPYLASLEESMRSTLAGKPVLTIFGEKNDPFGFQSRLAGYFDDVEELVIPDGNHFPMADDPRGVAARIHSWHLAKV